MSGQSIVMFLSVIAISIAAGRANDASMAVREGLSVNARGPASIGGKKELGHVHKDMTKHTHKARGPLSAVVELIGARPEQPGDIFVLKGVVSTESALENVEFSWSLPDGVEVVNGQTSSVIAALSAVKPFETQITLRQLSPANARVTLRVRGQDTGMRFGDMATYHTLDQQQLEATRLEMKNKTAEYMKSSSGSPSASGAKGNSETHSHSSGKKLKIFH